MNVSDEIVATGGALRVVEYLKAAFPGESPKVFEEPMRGGLAFRIGTGEKRRLLLVSDEVLDDTPEDKMVDFLQRRAVAKALEATGKEKALMVTSAGLRSIPIQNLRG